MGKIRDKQMHIYLPESLWREVKKLANDDAVTISAFVRALIVDAIKKRKA